MREWAHVDDGSLKCKCPVRNCYYHTRIELYCMCVYISLLPKGRRGPFTPPSAPSARPAGWWRGWRGSRASAWGPASSTCSATSPSRCVDDMHVACLVSAEKSPTGPFQRVDGCGDADEVVPAAEPLPGPHWGPARWRKRRSELRPRCWWCSQCSACTQRLWRRLRNDVLLVVRPSKSGRLFACTLRTVIGTIGVVRNINIIRSPGRAMNARGRTQAKGPLRPFLPALKRYASDAFCFSRYIVHVESCVFIVEKSDN